MCTRLLNVMDFHYVLPSNTSENYFPNNNASQYSTPVDNPYVLSGDWEVGLIDTCYSSCINSFNNDTLVIKEQILLKDLLGSKEAPVVKVIFPQCSPDIPADSARRTYESFINKTFDSILSVKVDKQFAKWTLPTDNYYFILSASLEHLFELWSDVITTMDANLQNQRPFQDRRFVSDPDDIYMIIVLKRASSAVGRVDKTLKKANEKITVKELLVRFKTNVPSKIATLTSTDDSQCRLTKQANDGNLVILNESLRKAMTFVRSGLYHKGSQQYVGAWLQEWDKPWIVSILTLEKIVTFESVKEREVILPPCSFNLRQDAIQFVNKRVNDENIKFTCAKNKRVSLAIASAQTTVTFSDTLRDIFAFDQNVYSGPKTYTASIFSLCRRI